MKTKHTDGPWKVNMYADDFVTIGNEKMSGYLAKIPYGIDRAEDQANARLIASAPEMLRALKHIISSAPITGLPLGLEKDIQSAIQIVLKAEGK